MSDSIAVTMKIESVNQIESKLEKILRKCNAVIQALK